MRVESVTSPGAGLKKDGDAQVLPDGPREPEERANGVQAVEGK